MFRYKPLQSQSYVFEFTKKSTRGCLVGKQVLTLKNAPETSNTSVTEAMNMSMAFDEADDNTGPSKQQQQPQQPEIIQNEIAFTLTTDDERGHPNCKSMSGFPIQFDDYLKNQYYF